MQTLMTFLDNVFDSTLCGIDEAGRGPLAGPLVMAGVILLEPLIGLNDSKKLTAKKREKLYTDIIQNSLYHIVIIDANTIDELGISASLKSGLEEIMVALPSPRTLFDGNSRFGVKGIETLIKADALIPQVSAASILAKVTRDRIMTQFATSYPMYGFEKHMGYGTSSHIEAIKTHGRSAIHRHSYKINGIDR